MSKWIKKDDQVIVITGNDKGKTGKVLRREGDFFLVQGINMKKKHVKKSQKSQIAQIIDKETPIHVSNIALCSKEGKRIKPRIKMKANGRKDLVYYVEGKENFLRTI